MADIDLIVPTVAGREESLKRCLESFLNRTPHYALEPIIVPHSETCGAGWIAGLKESDAPYVALVADDLECRSECWAEVCIESVEEGELPCPRVWTPRGTIESQGGDMHAFGHLTARHRSDGAFADFTTVPFMSREQLDSIGMIPTQYACDVWVSYRGFQCGYRTKLVHGYDLIHHQEQAGRGAGMPQVERDALDTETMFTELRYGSHTRVLGSVLDHVEPAHVLEIGAGRYSTGQFLRHPAVRELVSVEDDPEWIRKIREQYGYGNGTDWQIVPPTAAQWLEDYELVFVDGPENEEGRIVTIRWVLEQWQALTKAPPIVIHDADHEPYMAEIAELVPGSMLEVNDETAVIG